MSEDPFSFPVLAKDIPPTGRNFHIEADADQRRRLAESFGILGVQSLAADLDVRPMAGQAYHVRGTLNAAVVQTDVVTLDPVELPVAEEVDVTLMPAERDAFKHRGKEVLVDLAEEAGPDLYRNGRIDLGIIVGEHLALGLDPYPRAPGTAFDGHIEDHPGADPSPFAALEKLKQGSR